MTETTKNEALLLRCFIKERLQYDYTTLRGYETERKTIFDVLERTANDGASNSLLLIGPRGGGKTTLINSVITELLHKEEFQSNVIIVHLNGNLQTDDRIAIKSITLQMDLENVVDGKVFGSFAENLSFLLSSLKSSDETSKSVIFILEEFDLFCAHHNQTLLYNLFDIAQSGQAPICVLGATCRLDVIELLEKRVKSRFSHRNITLFPKGQDFDEYLKNFKDLLFIPKESDLKQITEHLSVLKHFTSREITFHCNHFDPSKYKFKQKFVDAWNKHINALCTEKSVVTALKSFFQYFDSIATLKSFLFRLISKIDVDKLSPQIPAEQITKLVECYNIDDKIELLCGLSVLELCLVIAMKHHTEIYDRDPFNFEIILTRFTKFAKVSTTMQGIERAVVLKAFEHLRNIELILPLSSTGKLQKEFEMHRLALIEKQIDMAVKKYQVLPTEVTQWAQSSLV